MFSIYNPMEAHVAKCNDKNKGIISYLRLTKWPYLIDISQVLA